MQYFDPDYRKNLRRRIVNYLYDNLMKTKLPPDIMAFMIKAHHFTFPLATYFLFMFAPLTITYVVYAILFVFFVLYVYLKGCFVSHLEYKLNNKDFINIADPILILFNYPINKETQYLATFYATIAYFAGAFAILHIRVNNQ